MDEYRFQRVQVLVLAVTEVESLRSAVEIIQNGSAHEDVERIRIILSMHATPACREMSERLTLQYAQPEIVVEIYEQGTQTLVGAIQNCIRAATCSHSLIMCADQETNPNYVPDFIRTAKKEPNALVTGSRMLPGGGFEGYGAVNHLFTAVFQWIAWPLTGKRLTDFTFGYLMIPNAIAADFVMRELGISGSLEYRLQFFARKLQVMEIPVIWRARQEGVSGNSFRKKFRFFRPLLRYFFGGYRNVDTNR